MSSAGDVRLLEVINRAESGVQPSISAHKLLLTSGCCSVPTIKHKCTPDPCRSQQTHTFSFKLLCYSLVTSGVIQPSISAHKLLSTSGCCSMPTMNHKYTPGRRRLQTSIFSSKTAILLADHTRPP